MGETHLRNLAAIAGVRVVVVADERADRAELGKTMSGAELATKDQAEAINHPSVHAVVISTPTDTHARLIELALMPAKPYLARSQSRWTWPRRSELSGLLGSRRCRCNLASCGVSIRATPKRRR